MNHNCPPSSEITEKLYIWFTKTLLVCDPLRLCFMKNYWGEKRVIFITVIGLAEGIRDVVMPWQHTHGS